MKPNPFFPEIHGRFAFGCMRLPMKGEDVDLAQFSGMIKTFFAAGFNYFDTAHGYIGGKSELALRECLTSVYPRSSYILTNKLSKGFFNKEEDILPLFQTQLECCGVDYFDFYLMHALSENSFEHYQKCRAFEIVSQLKKEGKIRHIGISFHDRAEVLDKILTARPEIEIVQIQFNYIDYEDESVESKKCYEVCLKHNKPILVMEPVKGGNLVNLPPDAQKLIDRCNAVQGTSYSNAAFALRFVTNFPQIACVLSGMSTQEQMEDNVSFMKEDLPLTEEEHKAIKGVVMAFKKKRTIACTSCHYCVLESHCPKNIPIPEIFSCYNAKVLFNDWNQNMYYFIQTKNRGKASDCIKCGACERVCPQHLFIRDLLVEARHMFEKELDEAKNSIEKK